MDIAQLLDSFALTTHNIALFQEALTHRSYLNETRVQCVHNERLEWLGDRVLGIVVAEYLFCRFGTEEESVLNTMLTTLVSTKACAQYCLYLKLPNAARLARGAQKKLEEKSTLLAGLFEAFLGALYLDKGLQTTHDFYQNHLGVIREKIVQTVRQDAKTALQNWTQKTYNKRPQYQLLTVTGKQHCPTFTVAVVVEEHTIAEGVGTTRKFAEQAAAQNALKKLGVHE